MYTAFEGPYQDCPSAIRHELSYLQYSAQATIVDEACYKLSFAS